MVELALRISEPPNQSTSTMSTVPKNSLIGWARLWRMATRLVALRYSLLHFTKRFIIFSSAINALMIRIPPNVSSSCDMVSLHLFWASSDWRFSLRPTRPMIHPITGSTMMVNRVSCQLVTIRVAKYEMIRIGFFSNISSELVMEFSISPTSPLIRAMMSPFRSSDRKLSGRYITFE